jgi:uncharacterized protein (TIGR00106 family)
VIIAFSVTPIGTGESVGAAVAEAVRVIRASGLPNETNALFTTIEGEWDEVMAVIKQAIYAVMEIAPRCGIVLKGDVRPDSVNAITSKVESVERHLKEID